LGAQRMQKLQREIDKMEEDQKQRQHLIEELSKMAEKKKKNEQEKILVSVQKVLHQVSIK
jgi:CHASE3 domain sensor protein